MIHFLRRSVWLPRRPPAVFAFFCDVTNLERITPPELRFRVLTPTPIALAAGTLLDYRLALYRIPLRWRTLITRWQPDVAFTDEQIAGPYRLWVHTHWFDDEGDGTRMRDEVRYRLPLSPLGELAAPLVALQLARIFDFREHAVQTLLA